MATDVAATRTPEPAEDPGHAEPYMKSGYELLAERDYYQQAYGAIHGPEDVYNAALDPAFTAKEWWRDFADPIEFQYGMFQQMAERDAVVGSGNGEDEQMVL